MTPFDIVTYSQFRERMASHLSRLKKSSRPTFLLRNGEVAAVVMGLKHYHELANAAEEGRWLRRLEESLLQANLGETVHIDTVAESLRSKAKSVSQ
jgi:PHD/YefM family antitoxin component YafN of YafNO toxin-antitoxin module